ncbi:hypothetical protein E1301_Tti021557 [Triplophysa tibetana]|uniref:Ig-like domain-containing protein n=1 Tax=Triplophysa tibetana TaxID=1572043 RepID=A0A5A9NAT9_9TELE|nr:hypothetical protein E1301_Tti021557 [Triplophysa tibetana]
MRKRRTENNTSVFLQLSPLTIKDSKQNRVRHAERQTLRSQRNQEVAVMKFLITSVVLRGNLFFCHVWTYIHSIKIFSGGTRVLSARHKADRWGWKLPNNREMTSKDLNNLHEDRVQMLNITSGNFSLLISNLTEEDEGLYSCWIYKNQHKYFCLAVRGCVVSESDETMMSHPGQSVLLSCTCEDDQTKPKHFEWRRLDLDKRIVSETERSTGRFQTPVHDSPANVSLLISDLTEADQGSYVCTVNGKQSRVINLIVKGSERVFMSILMTGLMMLMVLVSALCIYWRCVTAKKNRSRTGQREDHECDVTYAAVKLNMKPKLQDKGTTKSEDEVIYSSVVHSKCQ